MTRTEICDFWIGKFDNSNDYFDLVGEDPEFYQDERALTRNTFQSLQNIRGKIGLTMILWRADLKMEKTLFLKGSRNIHILTNGLKNYLKKQTRQTYRTSTLLYLLGREESKIRFLLLSQNSHCDTLDKLNITFDGNRASIQQKL